MKVRVEPGSIAGIIAAPPSKSMTQRAFAGALLHKGRTTIYNAGKSADEQAALQIIQQLGASVVQQADGTIVVNSNGVVPISGQINCNESGLATRLFAPVAALSAQAINVAGAGSLLQRDIVGLEEVFRDLGVALPGFNGHVPFTLQGPLTAKDITIDSGESSQLLSGLLFAFSYAATEPVTITVKKLSSKPYIDMTLDVLRQFGRPVANSNYQSFTIDPTLFTQTENITIDIAGDWSSAAGLLVAGAIAGKVSISGLANNNIQADNAIIAVLKEAGAVVEWRDGMVSVSSVSLKCFDYNATDSPDLFPVLAILAACCDGESTIKGLHRLFNKESNRAESIGEMLQSFDVPFSMEDDTLFVTGVGALQGTIIDSYNDHRIVMAAAIGALRANGPVDIEHAEAVNKSYPDFFKDLISCGGKCTFIDK